MVLFIGDMPSSRTDPRVAFKGAACEARLRSWIDAILPEGKRSFVLINRTDPQFKMFLHCSMFFGIPLVALGNNASQAIKKVHPLRNHFKLPHPSGRNRQINDKLFINLRLLACKQYLRFL